MQQDPTRREIDLDGLLHLETEVWEALVSGDAAADEALLAEDFLGVYPSGFADRSEHVGQLANGPTVAEFELSQARAFVVSPGNVMLAYRADFTQRGTDGMEGQRAAMYISSLWSRRDRQWLNTFSHDCEIEG